MLGTGTDTAHVVQVLLQYTDNEQKTGEGSAKRARGWYSRGKHRHGPKPT